MGIQSGRRAGPADRPRPEAAAALIQLAIDRVLRCEPGLAGLPEVLRRFASVWRGDAALALALGNGAPATLAAYPDEASDHDKLSVAVTDMVVSHPAAVAATRVGGAFEALLPEHVWPRSPAGALVGWSAGPPGEQRSAVVLIGDPRGWDAQTRSVARMLAAVVAAELRHTSDLASLHEGQAVSRALVEASPDAVVIMDSRRRVVAFNPAAEALYGWRRDDVIGKDMASMLIPPRDRGRFLAGTESFLTRRDPGEFTGRMTLCVLRADGSERLVELTPVPLVVGGRVYFCGFLRDESEIERTKAELRTEETRFRVLAERAPVAIAEAGPDGRCTFVNDRWRQLNGGAQAGRLGASWLSVIADRQLGRVREEWARRSSQGAELRVDCLLRGTEGPGTWARAQVAPLPGGANRPTGFAVALVEVPDGERGPQESAARAGERWSQQDLTDRGEHLPDIVATAIPAMAVADEHGSIREVNESFRGMFGIAEPAGALAGASAQRLLERVEQLLTDPDAFAQTARRLARGRKPAGGEKLSCADGRTVECDYWPVFAVGEYRGAVWMFRDITARQAAEERREAQLGAVQHARRAAERDRKRLAGQNARLREVDELKNEFIATVSHELRGPLTSIVSYVELVADEKDRLSPEVGEFLEVIERSSRQLTRLVGDLLQLSRIEAGVAPLELAPVAVPEVVTDAVGSVQAAADQRGIAITVSAGGGPPVQADRARLRQVIENLLSNAVKFSRPGGTVRVAARCTGGRWRIEVADSGIGIPEDEVGRVFDRFFRASNSRQAGRPGSGLGLAVVKALIELHGGTVAVSSAPGQGSTFSVCLPAQLDGIHDPPQSSGRGAGR